MKTINNWVIIVEWDNEKIEVFTDVPNSVADAVDEWLGEVESERGNEEPRKTHYYFYAKSHCEAPDCEMEFEADTDEEAVNIAYDGLKDTMNKSMIRKNMRKENNKGDLLCLKKTDTK